MQTMRSFLRFFAVAFPSLSCLPAPLDAAPPERLVIGAEARIGVKIVDPGDGNKLLWRHPVAQIHDLHLLPDFHLLLQDGWQGVVEIDLGEEVVWSYDAATRNREAPDERVEVHAFQRLSGGLTLLAESGPGRLIEVDRSGTIVKQLPLAVSKPSPHSDTRLVRKLDNGHYLVAHEADETVKEYDGDGQVVWEFPIPLFGKERKKGHGPESFGGKCFAATRLENGNTLISTGNGHSVLDVSPDKRIVWKLEQHDLDGVVLAWVTNVEQRSNGNLIIGNCHAGPGNPQIVEITRDKEVVWSFQDRENFGNDLANTVVVDGERARKLRKLLKGGG